MVSNAYLLLFLRNLCKASERPCRRVDVSDYIMIESLTAWPLPPVQCSSLPPDYIVMQSPSQEIQSIIELIHCAVTPDIQKAAINKYFTSDAALRTPWYSVRAGILSREDVLGIYQYDPCLISRPALTDHLVPKMVPDCVARYRSTCRG